MKFQIGIGGSIETYGSLLSMPNQTFHIVGKNVAMVIDSPTYIDCNPFAYGDTISYFCPDPYLYYQWEYYFKKMLQMHSFIAIRNFPKMHERSEYEQDFLKFDCPEGGTVLSYGDSRCQIEGLSEIIKDESNEEKCVRLVPMVLPSGTTVISRSVYLLTEGKKWETLYIPCISPMYICGYGSSDSNVTFSARNVNRNTVLTDNNRVNFKGEFTRNAKSDCMMSSNFAASFQNVRNCFFNKPVYNSTEFNIRLEVIQNNVEICLDDGGCGIRNSLGSSDRTYKCDITAENGIIGIHSSYFGDIPKKAGRQTKQIQDDSYLNAFPLLSKFRITGEIVSSKYNIYLLGFMVIFVITCLLAMVLYFNKIKISSSPFEVKTMSGKLWWA